MLTQQHFILMAHEISQIEDMLQRERCAEWCADIFKRDNPKFKRDTFYQECCVSIPA